MNPAFGLSQRILELLAILIFVSAAAVLRRGLGAVE